MPFEPQSKLGAYEILAKIGSGETGELYVRGQGRPSLFHRTNEQFHCSLHRRPELDILVVPKVASRL